MMGFNMREFDRIRVNQHIAWQFKEKFLNELKNIVDLNDFDKWFARVDAEYSEWFDRMRYPEILQDAYCVLMRLAMDMIRNMNEKEPISTARR